MALQAPLPTKAGVSGNALLEIAKIANELTGIQLNEKHFSMILSRLHKRIAEVGAKDLDEYVSYIQSHKEKEYQFLISTLTTHHTYFFRENAHFDFLTDKGIKFLVEKVRARNDKTLRIWSAAASRGQEVYSLAMHVSKILSTQFPDIKLEILGTDVDPESILIAKNGVYPWKEVKEIPLQYLNENWIRGKGEISEFAKAKSNIKSFCNFEVQNLLDLKLDSKRVFDIVFCRNVFIYFSAAQISEITKNLNLHLNPDGFLFLGISESLHGLSLPLKAIASSVYVRDSHPWVTPLKAVVKPKAEQKSNIKVMVVDDSPSIHKLMNQIFTPALGFEIVANAYDGIEAAQLLAKTKVDVVTLDIHMPKQDGIEYLRSSYSTSHPPVIMVTSVSREDSSFAAQALEIGASDYVEKPALNNLKERAEEIRTKVRCAIRAKKSQSSTEKSKTSLDQSFQTKMQMLSPETKARIITFSGADRKRVQLLLGDFLKSDQPPTLLIVDSAIQGAELIKTQLEKEMGRRFKSEDDMKSQGLKNGEAYFVYLGSNSSETIENYLLDRKTSVLALGEPSQTLADQILKLKLKSLHITVEDIEQPSGSHKMKIRTDEISPFSGFHYISDRFLCQK